MRPSRAPADLEAGALPAFAHLACSLPGAPSPFEPVAPPRSRAARRPSSAPAPRLLPGVAPAGVPAPRGSSGRVGTGCHRPRRRRNGSGQAATVRGGARKESGQAIGMRRVARNGSGQAATVCGGARNGSGQVAQAPPGTPITPVHVSQPRHGIFRTASSWDGELTDKVRDRLNQNLTGWRFQSIRRLSCRANDLPRTPPGRPRRAALIPFPFNGIARSLPASRPPASPPRASLGALGPRLAMPAGQKRTTQTGVTDHRLNAASFVAQPEATEAARGSSKPLE
jgi:hypothetical protein